MEGARPLVESGELDLATRINEMSASYRRDVLRESFEESVANARNASGGHKVTRGVRLATMPVTRRRHAGGRGPGGGEPIVRPNKLRALLEKRRKKREAE